MDGEGERKLYVRTPLIESTPMSHHAGACIHLKLENTQPSGTFKIRGISNHIIKEMSRGCKQLVCSSGGNAGMAAAYAARKLNMPLTLYVPGSTPQFTVDRLRQEGADVIVHGSVWDDANAKALEECSKPNTSYIHPFDHPNIWEGHASIMEEVAADMEVTPDLVVVSVGGGGLLLGLVQGMVRVGWENIPILAMETVGADCFNVSVREGKPTAIPDITSVAKCLGSLVIADAVWDAYKSRVILSQVVSDKAAVHACDLFLEDHKMLVEPACGAALAAVYDGVIKRLEKEGKLSDVKNVVMIVCGGMAVNISQLQTWKTHVGLVSL